MPLVIDDGWGGDEDLDISGNDLGGDGWGDDDVDLDVTNDDSLGGDGWGDDDDFFDDDDDDDSDTAGVPPPAPVTTSALAVDSPVETCALTNQKETNTVGGAYSGQTAEHATADFQGGTKTLPPPPRNEPIPWNANPQHSQMVAELSQYAGSLNRMLSSINAILEFEYNTYEKAEELVAYYSARPQLAEYTRTKELQRMQYEVVLPYGHVETSKDRIVADNLLPDDAIVSRAANQSLLADLLQVITGHDLIVRPQYFTICVASWCKFTIHRGDHGADMIDCRANLSLSLPTASGDRLNVAKVAVSVVFSPGQPMVEFRVQKIDVLLEDYSKLAGVAEFLSAMEGGNDEAELMNASPDIYRDAFLERSQRLLSISSEGMKSALQQVDSVVNISGKIQRISSFIPAADHLLEAEQEAMAFAEARQKELQQQRQQQHPVSSFPRPPPRAQDPVHDPSHNTVGRPKSILGGLVSSGWKTLAKTVALPDDDPALYGEHVPPPAPRELLYNKPTEPTPPLYRKENTTKPPGTQTVFANDNAGPIPPIQQVLSSTTTEQAQVQQKRNEPVNEDYRHRSMTDDTNEIQKPGHDLIASHPPSQTVVDMHINNENRAEKSIETEKVDDFHGELGDTSGEKDNKDESMDGDGWDDFGFDDDIDEICDPPPTSFDQDKEGERSVDSHGFAFVEPPPVLVNGRVYNPEDGTAETRKRWINPRPFRPYVKG